MADVKARQRARRIVQERGLTGLANDTKWREFFLLISGEPAPLEVKLIDDVQVHQCGAIWSPAQNYLESSSTGPELFVFIEWVRSDAVDLLQGAVAKVGLECVLHDGKVTVYGYR